jgi:hypothetical protein
MATEGEFEPRLGRMRSRGKGRQARKFLPPPTSRAVPAKLGRAVGNG